MNKWGGSMKLVETGRCSQLVFKFQEMGLPGWVGAMMDLGLAEAAAVPDKQPVPFQEEMFQRARFGRREHGPHPVASTMESG